MTCEGCRKRARPFDLLRQMCRPCSLALDAAVRELAAELDRKHDFPGTLQPDRGGFDKDARQRLKSFYLSWY